MASEHLSGLHEEVLDDGAQAQGGEERERPHDQDDTHEERGEEGPFVGKVPGPGGTDFFPARIPATASAGTIIRNRPISMARPSDTLYQGVLALIPAKAEPLFPAALEKA